MSKIAREAFLDEVLRIGGTTRNWVVSVQMLRPALNSGFIKSVTRVLVREELIEETKPHRYMNYRLTELGVQDCVNRAKLKRIAEDFEEEPERQAKQVRSTKSNFG